MTPFRKIVTIHAAIIVAGLTAVATSATMTSAAAPVAAAVEIANFTFKAPVLTVKPGTTVTWTNGDDIPHTVVSKDGLFKSKVLDTGEKFSFTFTKPGQFGYFCSIHPHMTGTIVVKA
jgi:plastocyanin